MACSTAPIALRSESESVAWPQALIDSLNAQIAALTERAEKVERELAEAQDRLAALLDDTQHVDHTCDGDVSCPVDAVRAFLERHKETNQ